MLLTGILGSVNFAAGTPVAGTSYAVSYLKLTHPKS
jgi:hypothetical protein